ncbi:TlpA disulfide reductase family protein [Thermoflexus sp.]|uniref:TlpA family protein disulfide reductase n=1 Tax=Thermoflexus sp. TaxID=1969742 RepID=UPI0017C4D219|nr:TlpA disulfide reductase family protein [Thermoflexus sp.]
MKAPRWIGIGLGIGLVLVGCRGEAPAPDFTVPTLGGGTFTLSRALGEGKPVVLFFMAYWCGTCIPEARALARLHQSVGDRVVIVALDVDPTSTPEALMAFREAAGSPDYVWAFDRENAVALAYRVTRLDTTVIIDPRGRIVFRDEIPTSYETLAAQVARILPPASR